MGFMDGVCPVEHSVGELEVELGSAGFDKTEAAVKSGFPDPVQVQQGSPNSTPFDNPSPSESISHKAWVQVRPAVTKS